MYRCVECTLAFRSPVLDREAYVQAYEQLTIDYWSANAYCDFWPDVEGKIFEGERTSKTILDVGCYTGDFLIWLKARHAGISISGIEPAKEAAAIAKSRGVEIIATDILHLAMIERRYDVIVLFDVFEHLPNIGECLDLVLRALAAGGLLVVVTGNYDSWTWRFMGADYYYCAIPEHVVFASTEWSARFARRKGLEIVFARNISPYPGTLRTYMLQGLRCGLYRVSKACEHHGLSVMTDLPFFRKAVKWSAPPGWHAAADHLLTVFQKP